MVFFTLAEENLLMPGWVLRASGCGLDVINIEHIILSI